MIRTVILDDDVLSQKAALASLRMHDNVKIVGTFTSGADLFSFLKQNTVDLLFLDIELNEELGFDIAAKLKEEKPELMLVFLTGHSSYAIDGYGFQPLNFLTKPINESKLLQTINEAEKRICSATTQQTERIMLRMKQGHQIVDVQKLCYFELRNRKTYMVMTDGEQCIGNYAIRNLEEIMKPYGFFCCHQSFVVSLAKVVRIQDSGVQLYEAVLEGRSETVPISRHRYKEMCDELAKIRFNTKLKKN